MSAIVSRGMALVLGRPLEVTARASPRWEGERLMLLTLEGWGLTLKPDRGGTR
jgi:hypothetical protein